MLIQSPVLKDRNDAVRWLLEQDNHYAILMKVNYPAVFVMEQESGLVEIIEYGKFQEARYVVIGPPLKETR